MTTATQRSTFNGVCPYYTMFPIDFPRRVLARAQPNDSVLDPFCGRGTTLLAAREAGLEAHGTDVSAVAVAISRAKISTASPALVMRSYDQLMSETQEHTDVPKSQFWQMAYHPETLRTLCRLRRALIKIESDNEPGAISILRAIALGALHGPLNTGPTPSSFFSNQMTRTFASKPNYAVKYWSKHNMRPPYSNVRKVLEKRAFRILVDIPARNCRSTVRMQDARRLNLRRLHNIGVNWIITSPPYYGMQTYNSDQWLRPLVRGRA